MTTRLLLLLGPGALALALLAGCGKPPALVHNYLLEYPAPVLRASAPLDESLKVERFAVAQAFNTTAMVYRPDPLQSATYKYHRWRVNPGSLVSDYLIRDFRYSGRFKAVLSDETTSSHRFLLEGGVEEFQEVDGPDGWKAALALSVTLLDLNRKEITKRVVFQKSYRAEEPLTAKTPAGLAQGMSRALESLSPQIVADVYRAAQGAGK
jgi:ABC-type uncharacterized transport system auxiliary subunit